MFELSGKTALVTGASGGIGGAIATALHAQGASIVLSGTRQEALDALKNELAENDAAFYAAQSGQFDQANVSNFARQAFQEIETLSVIVDDRRRT